MTRDDEGLQQREGGREGCIASRWPAGHRGLLAVRFRVLSRGGSSICRPASPVCAAAWRRRPRAARRQGRPEPAPAEGGSSRWPRSPGQSAPRGPARRCAPRISEGRSPADTRPSFVSVGGGAKTRRGRMGNCLLYFFRGLLASLSCRTKVLRRLMERMILKEPV